MEFNFNKAKRGAYGKYLQKDGHGYKFIGKGYTSKKQCLRSFDLIAATKEAAYLILAEKTKISPRFIHLEIVKVRSKFYPAIVMEHIYGNTFLTEKRHLADIQSWRVLNKKLRRNKGIFLSRFIHGKLKKVNIEHHDIHTNNILICPNKEVKIIDFGPTTTKYKGNSFLYKDAYKKAKQSLVSK